VLNGVDFNNILRAGYLLADHKSTKKNTDDFPLLGSLHLKDAHKNVGEIDPW